jgi:hypothetical protein
MTRPGFRWTDWSTPPVTATIVVTSWALVILLFALIANAMGFSETARDAVRVGRAFLAGGASLLAVALVCGFIPSRTPAGTVERPVHR